MIDLSQTLHSCNPWKHHKHTVLDFVSSIPANADIEFVSSFPTNAHTNAGFHKLLKVGGVAFEEHWMIYHVSHISNQVYDHNILVNSQISKY